MKYIRIVVLPALFLLNLCISCNSLNRPGSNMDNSAANDTLLRAEPYFSFAKQLEESVNNGQPDFFNNHFDTELLISRLFREISVPREFEQKFTINIKESVDAGAQIISSLEGTGKYRLVGITGLPNHPAALFRLTNNGNLNYHQFFFSSAPTVGLVRIEDFCIYKGGLTFAETLEIVMLNALAQQQPDVLNSTDFSAPHRAIMQNTQTIDKLTIAVHEQAFGKAMRLLKELPPEVQNHKMVLLQRLNIGYHLKNELLNQALNEFKQQYSNHAVAYFALLDMALKQKDNDQIIACSDALCQLLPADAGYLQTLKATAYENMGNTGAAVNLLTHLLQQDPTNQEAYRILGALYLDDKQYQKAIALFELMEQNIAVDPTELLSGMNYDEFWQSDYYTNWENPPTEEATSIAP